MVAHADSHTRALAQLNAAGACMAHDAPQIDPEALTDDEAARALMIAQRLRAHLTDSLIPRLAKRAARQAVAV